MLSRLSPVAILILAGAAASASAEEKAAGPPVELAALKALIGVWDAEIEVWPEGPDEPSIKSKGVETNRAFGEHWIASDFESTFQGQTARVHSIVGYDLDKQKLVGTVIDAGPYKATMTGRYDAKTETLHWTTEGKGLDGSPLVQPTVVVLKSPTERVLTLTPVEIEGGTPCPMMKIRYIKRKPAAAGESP